MSVLDLDDLLSADHAVGADECALTDPPLNADRAVVARPKNHFDHHAGDARVPADPPVHLRSRVGTAIERVGFIDGIRAE